MEYTSYQDLIRSGAEQRSGDWSDLRKTRFTASKFELLLKEPKDKKLALQYEGFGATAVSYVREKAMEVYSGVSRDPDLGNLYVIRRGRVLEAQAIRFYMLREGDDTVEPTTFYLHGPAAGGSPDFKSRGVYFPKYDTRLPAIAEVKCPGRAAHDNFLWDVKDFEDLKKFNKQYYLQLNCNMYFTGVHAGVFLSFDPTFFPADVYSEIDYENFMAETAMEHASAKDKTLALRVITGEMSPEIPELVETTLERAVRLRDRFVNELIERFG
jgi:hypothetical protein